MDPASFPSAPTTPIFPKAPTHDIKYQPEKITESKSKNPCEDCRKFASMLASLKNLTKIFYGTGNNIKFKESLKIYHEGMQMIVQHCIKCADDVDNFIKATSKQGILSDQQHREQLIRERDNHRRIALRAAEVLDKVDKCYKNMNYNNCYTAIMNA